MITLMKHNIGEVIETMCVGHVVDAKITEIDLVNKQYTCSFICHHDSGSENLCLDFGQNWNISKGETFKCGDVQIERAAYWLAQK